MSNPVEKNSRADVEIAVIGMAGCFPGARDIRQFWENLKNGIESLYFLSEEEMKEAGIEPAQLSDPHHVKLAGGLLKDKEYFDAAFFGYTPAEAGVMDPQVRIFHECVWSALEHAGYAPGSGDRLIGLYAGAANHFDWQALCLVTGKSREIGEFAASHLNDKDFLCTRVSHKLNLQGPAITVQTACSTSLTAIHLACQAILNGECDMALAGGVSVHSRPGTGYIYREGMILSDDGHCRVFDARAKGTVSGSGAGVVVLKLLEDALKDQDYIHAVIKGSAINNDGTRRSGYTAPSRQGQSDVITVAHQVAEIEPESIAYIETHGTGTSLGDPIEIEALTRAFDTEEKGFCGIGSVKSNVGHLGAAAGVTAFIKTVMALKHKQIPPSLHFETANPNIHLQNTPFYVNTQLKEWENHGYPLRAGVSSFGIGGTNVHVILEEWAENHSVIAQRMAHGAKRRGGSLCPPLKPRQYQLILLSAKTPTALDRMTENLLNFLKENRDNPGLNLADVAYTLQVGRPAFPHRQVLVCTNIKEALDALTAHRNATPSGAGKVNTFSIKQENPRVVFLFAGLGSQYVNMGLELYETIPLVRREMDRCFEILKPLIDYDLKEILYPSSVSSVSSVAKKIHQIEIAQLAVFIVEYALARLLMAWGIKPHAMMGYSFGEYTAACISGVFSLEDALKLLVYRGELLRQLPPGAMLSVPLSQKELQPLMNNRISLSIDNGTSCIVSGPTAEIHAFEEKMKKKRYLCMRLQASRALHSQMMDPILAEFAAKVKQVTLNKPQIPYISNLTGNWLTVEAALDPAYWSGHLRETVQFARGIKKLLKEPGAVSVEIGPGRDIGTIASRYINNDPGPRPLHLIRPQGKEVSDSEYLLKKIGQLWLYGAPIHWTKFYSRRQGHRIPLPGYPFERQRYWIEGNYLRMGEGEIPGNKPPADIADWFALPSWNRSVLKPAHKGKMKKKYTWMVMPDETGIGTMFVQKLRREGQEAIIVTAGTAFKQTGEGVYALEPSTGSDYKTLFDELALLKRIPDKIVHFWGISQPGTNERAPRDEAARYRWFDRAQNRGFYSLLYLAKAIGKQEHTGTIEIGVVTDSMREVSGEEVLYPEKAPVIGAVKVIPQEQPSIRCKSVDIILPKSPGPQKEKILQQLWEEFTIETSDTLIALRGNHRWIQTFEPLHLEEVVDESLPLKNKGVYLITGGLGKIGLVLAGYLARNFAARLILTTRSPFPPREEWDSREALNPGDKTFIQKINSVKKLEDLGAEVLVFSADAANPRQMARVIRQSEAQFQTIDGVIHAAGITAGKTFSVVRELDKALCEQQFQAKVYGLLNLEDLFKDRKPDFCLLMSSVSSVLGGLRFAAYAAANIFMDAYVSLRNRLDTTSWISVNWDGMDAEKTVTAFKRTLSMARINRLVVSTGGHLQDRIDRWIKLESLEDDQQNKPGEISTLKERPHLDNPCIQPRNEIEHTIVDIWQRLFGFRPVGIRDDFFELGGDSLKAITVISRMHKAFNIEVPLTEFFKRFTIESLAQYIDKAETSLYREIETAEKKEYYVLSSAQERLYILQEMEKESIGYNETQAVLLEGRLEKDRFEAVIGKLIERHESLRTSIVTIDDRPVQRIHPPHEIDFFVEYCDISGTGQKGTAELQQEKMIRDFIKPFDLSRPPFIRAALYRRDKDLWVVVIDRHHIVTDGVSADIFVKEFMALYGGKELAPLQIQYKDYAKWQNSEKQKESLQQQEAYWIEQFCSDIPVLELPGDYPRPPFHSFEGSSVSFLLGREETGDLKVLTQQEDVTLFMVLLAVYYILLSKLSGREDIVIGTPIAGRSHADLHYIMGIFINTLALRNYPAADKTFRQFLKEIKENTLKAFDNQEYQFEDLVEAEALKVNRDMSRSPLFDVMFVLQNAGIEAGEIPEAEGSGLNLRTYPFDRKIAKFDLRLGAVERPDQLFFTLEYCTRLFKRATIERFIAAYKKIITAILADRTKRLKEIEITGEKEKRRVLNQYNQHAARYPADKTIHQLFETQARQYPDRAALIGPCLPGAGPGPARHVTITYKELNEKSNRLAGVLRKKGVIPDATAAIMMERSVEMIMGILSILKAGGAYLPIDPGYPEERIDYMLKDSNACILLTHKDIVPFPSTLTLISTCRVSPANLAYIIYTSGTTGKPKGVLIEHKQVVQLMINDGFLFDIDARDVWSMFHAYNFDLSVWEMFGALLYGGKSVLVPKMTAMDTAEFLNLLKQEKVTVLTQTPSAFYRLMEEEETQSANCLHLKYVIFGGEALAPVKLKKWQEKYPRTRLINMYGITETTVHVTFKDIGAPGIESGVSNIGKPLPNQYGYVMDRHMKLQPPGITGELWVGGKGVGRGYLNQPGLTNMKFIRDPYRQGEMLYKSGDLVKYFPNGDMEYLGRIDHQVKIRGFRIELGEVESLLLKHPAVRQTVITAGTDETGDKYLCAYFVPTAPALSGPTHSTRSAQLKEYLSQTLPDYMIPSYFVEMENIPLTPNLKIHRQALPEPKGKAGGAAVYAPPVNEIQKKLAAIWAEILDIDKDRIGIDDHFFQRGGHSLKATIMASKVHKAANVKLPLTRIFKTPTIRKLAVFIQDSAPDKFAAIKAAEEKEYYPLTSAQKRLYVLQQMNKHSTAYNLPQMHETVNRLETEPLEKIFRQLIQRHDSLRTSFRTVKETPVQTIRKEVRFKIYSRESIGEIAQARRIIEKFVRPFDMAETPLLRVGVIKMTGGGGILLTDMHHIISDAVSNNILLQDFTKLSAGEELPVLRLRYKDYAQWEHRLKNSTRHRTTAKTREEFWLQQFKEEIPLLRLPLDFQRPAEKTMEGTNVRFRLSPDRTAALETISLQEGATLYMTVLALFNVLLAKLSGQEDIVVGTPTAGRRHNDLQQIIGMFVGTLALRNYPAAAKTFNAFLEEIKQRTLEALENQDYPLEDLLAKITVPKHPARNPLFDVFYQLSSFTVEPPNPSNPKNTSLHEPHSLYRNKTSKFDLYLYGEKRDGNLMFSLEYSTQLFKRETIEMFIKNFKEIVSQIIGNTQIKLEDITLSGNIYEQEIDIPETGFAF